MFNIYVVMPSGARSRGYERVTEEKALECFEQVKRQIESFDFSGAVVLSNDGKELCREVFGAQG